MLITRLFTGLSVVFSTSAFVFARTPNVILFYADDMGIGDVGCYGCKDIRTPNIDALAKAGVRFTNYYSTAPICSPSRAALLTGRYPMRCGVPTNVGSIPGTKDGLPADEVTIGELAKSRGYATGLIGKWHLGFPDKMRPNAQGFDYFFGFLAGCIDYYSHNFYWHDPFNHDLWRDHEEIHLEGQYMTDLISQEAQRFIDDHKSGPFLLYVPFNAPHYPMHAPQKWIDPYKDLPPNRRIHAAMVSAMDDAIGRIIERVRANNLSDDTLIFFASDNGATTEARANGGGGSNGIQRGFKFSLFDGGIHLPGMVSWPGHIGGGQVRLPQSGPSGASGTNEPVPVFQTRDQLVAAIDVLPTVAEAIGATLPADRTIDGQSWWPLLRNATASGHDALFWQQGQQRAVRRGKWKLVMNGAAHPQGDPAESSRPDDKTFLSDLEADPGESHNLTRTQPEIVQQLRALHARWLESLRESPATATSP